MGKNELLEKELDELSNSIRSSQLPSELALKATQLIEQLRISWEIGDFINNYPTINEWITLL